MNKYIQVPCNKRGKAIIDLKDGPGSDPYRFECSKEYQGDLCDKFGKIGYTCI
jgi:phage-related protein